MATNQQKLFTLHLDNDMVKRLIDTGFYENKYKDLLKQAIDFNNIEIIRYILDKNFVDIKKTDYLYYTIVTGNDSNILTLLLDYGADPNNVDYYKLYSFANHHSIDLHEQIKLFLRYGLDVNVKNKGQHSLPKTLTIFHDETTLIEMIPYI